MTVTIGTLMALSFGASLFGLVLLIWAIHNRQFAVSERQGRQIFESDPHEPEDPGTLGYSPRHSTYGCEASGLILTLIGCAVFWLLAGSLFGLTASLKLHMPDWLNGSAPLTFGRVRTVHLNAVAYGWLSGCGIAAVLFVVPRVAKTKLQATAFAWAGAILWNVGVAAGLAAIATGWTDGLEWLEIPWQIDIVLALGAACFAVSLVRTMLARTVHHIYVSGWYLMAALVWFPVLFVTANVPGVNVGAQQATVNWWYAHNVLGLWLTPIGVGLAYYILPKIIGKPIYSYRLSLLGFWGLALFYSQVGIHHLIGGPIPTWVVTLSVVQSVMMFVPVIAVGINHHVLVGRNLWAFHQSIALRFVAVGAVMYTLASFQGALTALRSVNTVTHFTHYTIAHAHIGAYGFVSFVLMGAIYYIVPILTRRAWPVRWLVSLNFWLATIGIAIYVVSLTIGGWLQGQAMLDPTRQFFQSMELTVPYLKGRSLGGLIMTLAHIVLALNLVLMAFARKPAPSFSAQAAAT